MQLQWLTWPQVEEYLSKRELILVPIGSTEQHGPNGYIGTDALCPQAIAQHVGDRHGIVVAPTISVGMAQHHLGFPGSMTLRPTTLINVIVDTVKSLQVHGFRQVCFINGHGGNIATIRTAFDEYHAERSLTGASPDTLVQTFLLSWWEGRRVSDYSKQHFANSEGSHATPTEVSLTYYLRRPQFEPPDMTPEIAPRNSFLDARDYRQKFPDGRIGSNPGLATAEHGAEIFEAATSDLVEWLESRRLLLIG